MKKYFIGDKCLACGICVKNCPVQAIHQGPGIGMEIDAEKCIGCGTCARSCDYDVPKERRD